MSLITRLVEFVNATLQPMLDEGVPVPPEFRLLTEDDLNNLPDEALAPLAEIIFAAIVYPMVYGEPEEDPESQRMYKDAMAQHPVTIALAKAMELFDSNGMDGDLMVEVGTRFGSSVGHMLVYQEPWEGLLWRPQSEENHLRHADDTEIRVGGPDTKKRMESNLQTYGLEKSYYEFCDRFSMAVNQNISDIETLAGLFPGILVEDKGEGVFLLTMAPSSP